MSRTNYTGIEELTYQIFYFIFFVSKDICRALCSLVDDPEVEELGDYVGTQVAT